MTATQKIVWGVLTIGALTWWANTRTAAPGAASAPTEESPAVTNDLSAIEAATSRGEPAALDTDRDDGAVDADGIVKGGETYSEYDARRDALDGAAGESHGSGCTQDCSGHDAGYAWAEDHGVTSADDCGGKSWSFQEGCQVYAEEREPKEADEPTETE